MRFLPVGDGLVSQIPSLLISLSSGIVVTKASKEVKLPELIIGELFTTPVVLRIVGIVIAVQVI